MFGVVIGYGILAVVETAYGDHLVDAFVHIGQVGGISAGTSRIQLFEFGDVGLGDAFAVAGGMDPTFFVANRPHEDRGMIAVAFHQTFELAHVFRSTVEQALLVHHQHAQAIAGVEQFGSGGVVAAAVGIGAHVFEQCNPVELQVIGQGTAYSRVVLMAIDAVEFDGFAVEEDAIGFDFNLADAVADALFVEQFAI